MKYKVIRDKAGVYLKSSISVMIFSNISIIEDA